MAIEYKQARLDELLAASQMPEARHRKNKFWQSDDLETARISGLPHLSSKSDAIRIDPATGEIFISMWHPTNRIDEEYVILGKEQNGRNYHENPPKTKILQKLVPHRFSLGIEVAIRGAGHGRDEYALAGERIGREAAQMADIFRHLGQGSEEDVEKLMASNRAFLERARLTRPRNPEKRKIAGNLLKGPLDKNGEASFIAGYSRDLSSEYAALRRFEQTFRAVSEKFGLAYNLLDYERGSTRFRLERAIEMMDQMQTLPADGQIMRIQIVLRGVRVRPYLSKARRAIVNLGLMKFETNENWEKYRQDRRERGFLSAAEHFRRGEWEAGMKVIDLTRTMLVKVLEEYADLDTVKKEYHKKHPVKS